MRDKKAAKRENKGKTLGVILARAGSKGLKSKNARVVAGKPMVRWTIEHALFTARLDYLCVSTDCPEVRRVATEMGVDVINRPEQLASDIATVDSAARHAVEISEAKTECRFDAAVILYGNVPVRPLDLSERALEKLYASDCDSVQSVCPVGKHHPYWMKSLGGEAGDELEAYQPNDVYRRQELPPVYQLDGGVIAVSREALFTVNDGEPHAFLGKDRKAVVTQPGDVVDIDDETDLAMAELRLTKKMKKVKKTKLAS